MHAFLPISHAAISSLSSTENRISFQFYLRSICLANLLQADLHSNCTGTMRVTCATFAPLCTVVSLLSGQLCEVAVTLCGLWFVCGSRDSSIKCQNKKRNQIKQNFLVSYLSRPDCAYATCDKQHLSSCSDCSCCSCWCWCCCLWQVKDAASH